MDFDKIKDAVNSIEMSNVMKYRVVENCNSIRTEKKTQLDYKRWISIASILAIILSITILIPSINNMGLQATNFTITAYAVDDDNQIKTSLSSEKAIFELSTQERIGVVESVGGGANLVFTNIMLKITGEDIDSIEYRINKGKFIEDVILTNEERTDREWILSEKIYIIYGELGSEISQGIKEIGKTYTLMYNEQDKYKYTLAIPCDAKGRIDDDIIINVNVKYIDGNTEQEDIMVGQEFDAISLRLK